MRSQSLEWPHILGFGNLVLLDTELTSPLAQTGQYIPHAKMKQLKRQLPPLTSLVAFEAAARLGSFTTAAEELNVSREAVSRQIRSLETYLGVKLFDRDANTAAMGPLGQHFYATVSPNLWAIASAANELAGDRDEERVATEEIPASQSVENEDLPTLLIVDDCADNIHHLYGLLSDSYRVIAQRSGRDALAHLSKEAVDLILLDIRMPDMDGYETCRRIKATASLAEVPVIFVTNLDDPADETRGLELGACDFISRPVVPAVIKARIRTHIALRQSTTALENLLTRRADRLQKAENLLAKMAKEIDHYRSE
ncbi:response regulator [Shimia sp. R10_1]|uniref:response regulator n=1 Tax=Shimia sp. R10_1 TaxID=2821095 RepID=UPI001ADCE6C7|nr:response regulator [Shimia sp. R10_1]MBO9474826.1 response regulator [Shimia sp. R10_1]